MEIKANGIKNIKVKIHNIAKKVAYWKVKQEQEILNGGDAESYRRNIECDESRLVGVIHTIAILVGRDVAMQLDDYYDECLIEQVEKLRKTA